MAERTSVAPAVTPAAAVPARRYQLDTDVARLTRAERVARGKAARAQVPRDRHAVFDPPPNRPDPIALLEEQAQSRVPELVPVRWARMAVSPFTFFRGAALPMASDLAATPVTGLPVQACGDAHLSNFGIFGSPERHLVFDVNDFDETLPGPWEWDVKRLAASLEIAARGNNFTGKQRRQIVMSAVSRYRQAMRSFAGMTNLDVWYAQADMDDLRAQFGPQLKARQRRAVDKGLATARTKDSMQAVAKLTRMVDGRLRILSDPPLIVPIDELTTSDLGGGRPGGRGTGPRGGKRGMIDRAALEASYRDIIARYQRTLETDRQYLLAQYNYCDMARKVVGVGSVGTRCWIVLMLGRDEEDPLFLQVKEAQTSVLSRFVGASRYTNQGHRVVAGQRLMQASSDVFLGYQHVDAGLDGQPRDFYVRQLRDWKFSVDIETLLPDGMRMYAELCGWALARAHARSGDRIAIAAYLGGSDAIDRAIAQFADAYADQTERDYKSLTDAIAAGRVTAANDP
jgi:uncharacterized protein (DUF2252 family)